MITRRKIAMIVAEFLGTGVLTLVILASFRSQLGVPFFVSIAAGLAVIMATLVLGGISGAHLNPAITLAMWTVRRVKAIPALVYIVAQLAGAMGAYWLYTYLVGQTIPAADQVFEGHVLVAEAVGALIFSLGWAAVAYQRMESAKAAAVIGISLIAGMMVAATGVAAAGVGYFINPAVAWGAHTWVWGTYALGPVLGAVIGFNLYGLLFAPAKELSDLVESNARKKKNI